MDDEDGNDAMGTVLSYDEDTGVLVIETEDGNLTGLVTTTPGSSGTTAIAARKATSPGGPWSPARRSHESSLKEGVFWKVYLVCDEDEADDPDEEEPGDEEPDDSEDDV